MASIEKSYMKIKLRKGKIWAKYQESFPTSEI